MLMSNQEIFYHLVQIAIGTRDISEFKGANPEQWMAVFSMAKKQGLLAVTYGTIEKLPSALQPPLQVKFSWIRCMELIVKQNEKISALCREVDKMMTGIGIRSCVLKGQGMATYYPNPLYRNSGDIDLWIRLEKPSGNFDADVEEMLKRIESLGKGKPYDPGPHHAEWKLEDISIELHYLPGEFYVQKYNERYKLFAQEEFKNNRHIDAGFSIPTTYFNMVQQMEHLQRHLLFEGIGLRQLCDYAILLLCSTEEERKKVAKTLGELNLKRSASALMWVIKKIFGVPEERLLFKPDEKLGKIALLDAMDFGGNLARQRYHMPKEQFSALSSFNKFRYMLHERKRSFKYAPRETFAELCHQISIIIKNRK